MSLINIDKSEEDLKQIKTSNDELVLSQKKEIKHNPNICGNKYCSICENINYSWGKKKKTHNINDCKYDQCSICWQIKRDKYWNNYRAGNLKKNY